MLPREGNAQSRKVPDGLSERARVRRLHDGRESGLRNRAQEYHLCTNR